MAQCALASIQGTLLEVRGIGPWSVDMFAMFGMGHLDIFLLAIWDL